MAWGGNGQVVYVWGHNHRGQLSCLESSQVKKPIACDSLSFLKPVQVIGGEQTMFAVTSYGKVYASGMRTTISLFIILNNNILICK
jgi:E3 ubiquitin-protein ligase HERC2